MSEFVEMNDHAHRRKSERFDVENAGSAKRFSVSGMSLDQALEAVGGFGKFQKWQTLSMGICWLITGMYALGPVTWAPRMNKEESWGGCQEEQFANTAYFAAQFTGNMVFAPTADKYGRKITLLLTLGIASVGGCICFLATSLHLYVFGRIVSGFGTSGITLISTVLLSEIVSQEHRALVVCFVIQSMYSFGMMAIVPVSWYAPSWRSEVLITTMGAVVWFPLLLLNVRESPRFLLSVNQPAQCLQEFREIGNSNGRPLPQAAHIAPLDLGKDPNESGGYTVVDLMRHDTLRGYTINMSLQWLIIGTVYFGITLASGQLGGDTGTNLFVLAIVEIPAYWIGFRMMDRVGRRPVLLTCHIIAAVACMLYPLAPPAPTCDPDAPRCGSTVTLRLLLAVLGKMGISGTFGTAYVYCTELFPTVVRNLGTGIATQFANLGALLAPQLLLLASGGAAAAESAFLEGDVTCQGSDPGRVMVLFGVLAVAAAGSAMWLPETKGLPLAETFEAPASRAGGRAWRDPSLLRKQSGEDLQRMAGEAEVVAPSPRHGQREAGAQEQGREEQPAASSSNEEGVAVPGASDYWGENSPRQPPPAEASGPFAALVRLLNPQPQKGALSPTPTPLALNTPMDAENGVAVHGSASIVRGDAKDHDGEQLYHRQRNR